MPSRKPLTHVTDPARIAAMRKQDKGFYAPLMPPREAVEGYLRLHNETRPAWDECPEVGVLRAPFSDSVTSYPLPIPEGTWSAMQDPLRVVRKLAHLLWVEGRTDHALLRSVDRSLLADMVGVYFRYEAFGPPRGKEVQSFNLLASGHHYRFQDTGDAREARMILAVQVDGLVHSTNQYRDAPREVRYRTFDPSRDDQVDRIGGAVPRLLLDIALGLIRHMRPAYANNPEDNL